MLLLAQLFLLFLCLLMFKVKRNYKLAIFIFASICLNDVIVRFIPFGGAKFILSFCFILSELIYIKYNLKEIKKTVLYTLTILMIIATFILLLNSPHYYSFVQVIRLIIFELIAKYFLILYSFICIKKNMNLLVIYKVTYWGMLILTFFGLLNFITRNAIWINWMYEGMEGGTLGELGNNYSEEVRFRVQAMFHNPFNYGYICIVVFLFYWYGFLSKLVKRRVFYIITLFCLFGIITCGCRSIIICYVLSLITFSLFAFESRKLIKYIISLSLLIVLFIAFNDHLIDTFLNEISNVLDTRSYTIGTSGSSLGMRSMQLLAVFSHIRDNILFGRGYGYFAIDMGWAEGGLDTLVDRRLWGLEGIYLSYLLERGFIGLSFWGIYFFSIFRFIFKNRKYNRLLGSLGISILIAYTSFSNMTGELDSEVLTLLLLGVIIKLIYQNKRKNEIQHYNPCL